MAVEEVGEEPDEGRPPPGSYVDIVRIDGVAGVDAGDLDTMVPDRHHTPGLARLDDPSAGIERTYSDRVTARGQHAEQAEGDRHLESLLPALRKRPAVARCEAQNRPRDVLEQCGRLDGLPGRVRRAIETHNVEREQARRDVVLQELQGDVARARIAVEAARKIAANTPIELEAARTAIVPVAATARRVQVVLPFPETGPVADAGAQPGRCQWPFNATWITAAGDVTPCCNLHDPRHIRFGDAFREPLASIWRGRAYADFRARYRADAVAACRTCPVHYGQFKSYRYGRAAR